MSLENNCDCINDLQENADSIALRRKPLIGLESYRKLINIIRHKIWMHNNKKELFKKGVINYYLSKIYTIKTNNQEIMVAIEKYGKLLRRLKKEIEGYEHTVQTQNKMSFNINVSQDIQRLKNIRLSENIENHGENLNQSINVCFNNVEENNSLSNISQSLLTNDDFLYSDSPLISTTYCNNSVGIINNVKNINTFNSGTESFQKNPLTLSNNENNQNMLNECQYPTKLSVKQKNNVEYPIHYSKLNTNQSLMPITDFQNLNSIVPGTNAVQDSLDEFEKNSISNIGQSLLSNVDFRCSEPSLTQQNSSQNLNIKDINTFQKCSDSCMSIGTDIQKTKPRSILNNINVGTMIIDKQNQNFNNESNDNEDRFSKPMLRNLEDKSNNKTYLEVASDSGISSTGSRTFINESRNISKKRKIYQNQDIYHSFTSQINHEVTSAQSLDRNRVLKKPLKKAEQGSDEYLFDNLDIVKQRLQELNSMINAFKTFVLEGIDVLCVNKNKEKRKAGKEHVKVNPFFFNKNDVLPIRSKDTTETNQAEKCMTLENFSYVYGTMYKELFSNIEFDTKMLD